MTLKLSRSYELAGCMVDELDLSPIETAPFELMLQAERMMMNAGELSAVIEADYGFLIAFIALALEIPEADLQIMDIYDGFSLVNNVLELLGKQAEAEGYTIKLSQPFSYEHTEKSGGMAFTKTDVYEEIDLSGLNELTYWDVRRAQRATSVAVKGVCVAPSADAHCLMMLASKASGLPYDFFKKLPAGVGNIVRQVVRSRFFTPRVSAEMTQQNSSDE